MAGKGDRPRPVNRERYNQSYDRIFGRKEGSAILPLPFFQSFPKIYRLFRPVIVTEKMDGTNAQVYVHATGRVLAGSRKRYITPEDDNFGFAAWVKEHEEELRQLGIGRHFGEWWGRGIQRNYGLDHRRFSLFNVGRWRDTHGTPTLAKIPTKELPSGEIVPMQFEVPACCHVVPVLYEGPFNNEFLAGVMYDLHLFGSSAAPGFGPPEGIVVFHTQSGYLFKSTFENDEEGKGTK